MINLVSSVGRYGGYIWPAYGVSLAGLLAMIAYTRARAWRWRREVDQRREGMYLGELDDH